MACEFCGKPYTPYHDPEMVECAKAQVAAMAEKLRAEWRDDIVRAMPKPPASAEDALRSQLKDALLRLYMANQHEHEAVQGRADQALLVETLKKQMADGFAARDADYARLWREERQVFAAIGEALEPGAGVAPVVESAAIDDVKELRIRLDEATRKIAADAGKVAFVDDINEAIGAKKPTQAGEKK